MNRRLLTIVVALVLAAVGTLAVLTYVRSADDRAVAGNKAVSVLVAARAIAPGTPVAALQQQGYLRTRNYPASSVPDDAISQLTDDQLRLVVASSVRQGGLITASVMAEPGSSQAFVIPEGKIAVTVALDEAQRVANFAKPGTKVVVFVGFSRVVTKGTGDSKISKTEDIVKIMMADVPVLAVGESAAKSADADNTANRKLITLGVTQEQGERLILGATANALYMGLQTDSSELNVKSPGISSIKVIN
ncbi:Flp pilus assembly protein CpaB [Actinocorallia longicatena]|uniref:SAF domain-containing protein n=1 Tax=Actinocorallia longicatena TaxID=111803 RepID=A0ABP6QH15_9ACTN